MHKNFAQKPNFYLVRDSIFLKIMTSFTSILAFRANRQSLTTSIYFSPAMLHASVDNQWVDCPGFTLINDIFIIGVTILAMTELSTVLWRQRCIPYRKFRFLRKFLHGLDCFLLSRQTEKVCS